MVMQLVVCAQSANTNTFFVLLVGLHFLAALS